MDTFTELGVFTRVVDLRSFTRAGEQLGLTASGVSRAVSRLEERLGIRLLNRTTRSLSLTDDGAAYYDRCKRILAELEDANLAMARARGVPSGRIRVDAPVVLGEHVLAPAISRFLTQYPEVALDLSLRDHLIDPVAEGIDVVLRMAQLEESELIAKKVGVARTVIAGAPGYFVKHGRPRDPGELRQHACIGFLSSGAAMPWRLQGGGGDVSLAVPTRFNANSGAVLRQAALGGLGLIQVFEQHITHELASGALEPVLTEHQPAPRPVYALYARQKHALPKIRAFLQFLGEVFAQPPPRRQSARSARSKE